MQRTVLLCVLSVCCAGLAFGCQSHKDKPAPTMTERDRMNVAAMQGHPDAVREGFTRDHPEALITGVVTYDDSDGRRVYQVNYVANDREQRGYYLSDGSRVPDPTAP